MAIKYYETALDRMEDEEFNNSPDLGMTKKMLSNGSNIL